MAIRTCVYGIGGKMGHLVAEAINKDNAFALVCGVDRANIDFAGCPVFQDLGDYTGEVDLLIDFSHASQLEKVVVGALSKKAKLLVATTGHSEEQLKSLIAASAEIGVLKAANTSLGVYFMKKITALLSAWTEGLYDVELVELHHAQKVDSPSGTAKMLAHAIEDARISNASVPVHALRLGGIYGEHTAVFAGPFDTIEVTHRALSRALFAEGALTMGKKLMKKDKGYYTVEGIYE